MPFRAITNFDNEVRINSKVKVGTDEVIVTAKTKYNFVGQIGTDPEILYQKTDASEVFVETLRYRAPLFEIYYYVGDDGGIYQDNESNDQKDNTRFNFGNYWRTPMQATQFRDGQITAAETLHNTFGE